MATHRASCQCGATGLEGTGEPDFVIACNCRACQKRSGSPFGSAVYFRTDALKITGTLKSWGRKAESGRGLINHFCPDCGTTLYWTLDMRPDHTGVPLGLFDDTRFTPIRAIWTEEKHDWVEFPADWPQFEKGSPT